VVARQRSRDGQEVLQAHLWDQQPIVLSQVEWDVIHAIDGEKSVTELGVDGVEDAIRRLAERGVIELVG
jgi:hypothetical protein